MISGVLLVGREMTLKTCIKRVLRTIIQLMLITLVCVLYRYFRYNDEKAISYYFEYLYVGSGLSAHLWFMYAYVSFLIILPILNMISKHIDAKTVIYILAIIFIYKLIEMYQFMVLGNRIRISPYLEPGWLMNQVFLYPILGYYFGKKLEKIEARHVFITVLIGLVALILPIIENVYYVGTNGGTYSGINSQTFHNKFVEFLTIPFFVGARFLFDRKDKSKESNVKKDQKESVWTKIKKVLKNIIVWFGRRTFGIYIIHIMVKDLPQMKDFNNQMVASGCNVMIANMIYVACVFIIAAIIVFISQLIIRAFRRIMKWIYL